MAKHSDYYPEGADRDRERRFTLWLEGPGDDYGLFVGGPPDDVAKAIPNGRAKGKKPSDFNRKQLRVGTKHEREHTTDDRVARRIAMDHLVEDAAYYRKLARMEKALPKKSKETPVKKQPTAKVASKKAGARGRTRYTYPQEQAQPRPKRDAQPIQHPVDHGPPRVDPAELANQLGVTVATLHQVATRFAENPKLGGMKGFVHFMQTRLKHVGRKHGLDGDYWRLMWQALSSLPAVHRPG